MKTYAVKLDDAAYAFYHEISKIVGRPIEDILSDTLYKFAEITAREMEIDAGPENEKTADGM